MARFLARLARWGQQHVPERVWAWWVVTRLIFSRAYPGAAYAVKKVATDTDLYRHIDHPKKVQILINKLIPNVRAGENIIRLTEAREWTGHWLKERGREVDPVEQHVLVELAYLAYRTRA